MESTENFPKPPRVTLKDISSFLSNHIDDKDRSTSLEERTNCAIILLESLPCARYAVLEKIGEVFFDEAQKYVLELEKLHLAGMPAIYEMNSSTLDVQIRKIQQVLVSFVEGNSKAWGPMIFQWTVQTLSQICGQYATKRHFTSLSLEERFQMWLNCTATNVLLEIMVSCLHKIIHKNQDNCLKCLLNATLVSVPYFNWALAHLCCVFPSILPYKLLCHASEAFSKHSRKIEVIVDTMLSIFHLIHGQKKEFINDALFKLFTENLVNEKENHVILCTIPFLLHICNKSIELLKPLIDKVLDMLTHDNLYILQEQSLRRDEVLQRRSVNMVSDCIKEIDQSSNKVLQFLVKYSCQDDDVLIEDNPTLAASAQSFCSLVLQNLCFMFANKINIYLHCHKSVMKNQNAEMPVKIPFLCCLGNHIKQLCKQMLNSTGTKRDVLQEILKLLALQEGIDKMCEILTITFVNSPLYLSKSCLMYLLREFKIYEPSVVKKLLDKIFLTMVSSKSYSFAQVKMFLKNIQRLNNEEKCGFFEKVSVISCMKPYVKYIAQIIVTTTEDEDIPLISLDLLQKLSLSDLHISEYAIIVQAVLSYYFDCMKKLCVQGALEDYWHKFKCCNQLLLKTINQYISAHQYIIRVLLEGVVRKEEEQFSTESEEPLIKVELMKRNLLMAQGNRFNTITSVTFKDGLKLSKKSGKDYGQWKKNHTRQLFINTLSSLLSISVGSKVADYAVKGNKFTHHWGEKQYTMLYPAAHAYAATVLVELVCPEMVPVMPWPDEDLLKYTIERDLKVKNMFDNQPVLWDIMEVISSARPSLYHCSVLIQSLFGMSLKFWQTNRNLSTTVCSVELNNTCKLMHVIRNAGWLPSEIDTISDIFTFIKPKEVYDILSAIWIYFKNTSYSPDRFIDRDQLGLPSVPVNAECLQNVKSVIQIVFLRNIAKLGYMYHRFHSA